MKVFLTLLLTCLSFNKASAEIFDLPGLSGAAANAVAATLEHWYPFMESTATLHEEFKVSDQCRLTVSVQPKVITNLKHVVKIEFCAKNGKCIKETLPSVSFTTDKKDSFVRDLYLNNLNKKVLLQMAKLHKENNLAVVVSIIELSPYHSWLDKTIGQMAFDFDKMIETHEPSGILHPVADIQIQAIK